MNLLRDVIRAARCGISIKNAVRVALLTNEMNKIIRGRK